jgi:hypothetical protein
MHGMFDLVLEIHTRVHLVYQISDFFGVPENSIRLISGLTMAALNCLQHITRVLLYPLCHIPARY